MRIIHLSDIHLSKANYTEFKNNYREALINDLVEYNKNLKIDIIVITGDLVDKGGESLYYISDFSNKEKYTTPYVIFEEVFITPIITALNFDKNNFLFIPGNHDVDENGILLKEEYNLYRNTKLEDVPTLLSENNNFKHSSRIKRFKEFEKEFHETNGNYTYTPNESTYVYNFKNKFNIGFLLINDSWRCKSIKFKEEEDKMYFGIQQLHDGLNNLARNETQINIALLHHHPVFFHEQDEMEGFLSRKNIDLLLYGHNHSNSSFQMVSPNGSCYYLRSKASLFKPEETNKDYMPGYQIINIDVETNKITSIEYREYNNKPEYKKFTYDSHIGNNGIDRKTYLFSGKKSSHKTLNKEDFKS